jgi:hypothetical protein
MKWISKKAAVMDETAKFISDERKAKYYENRRKQLQRKRQATIDGEKLRAFIAVSFISRKQVRDLLNMSENKMSSILYAGQKLSHEQAVIIDAKLKEEGIEIKEKIVRFE